MSVDIKLQGRTFHIEDVAVNRFITTNIISAEEAAKMRGIIKSAIKLLLRGEKGIENNEASILATYVVTYLENKCLFRYASYTKRGELAEAEDFAVNKSDILERTRELATSVKEINDRNKLSELLLWIIKHDYDLF